MSTPTPPSQKQASTEEDRKPSADGAHINLKVKGQVYTHAFTYIHALFMAFLNMCFDYLIVYVFDCVFVWRCWLIVWLLCFMCSRVLIVVVLFVWSYVCVIGFMNWCSVLVDWCRVSEPRFVTRLVKIEVFSMMIFNMGVSCWGFKV